MRVSDEQVSEAQSALQQHGSITAAAAALGIARSTLSQRLKGGRGGKAVPGVAKVEKVESVGFSLDDFRRQYDKSVIVPEKVMAALSKLGPDRFLPEQDFVKLAGVNYTDLGRFRPQFEKHVVTVQEKRLWAGSVELANAMRTRL